MKIALILIKIAPNTGFKVHRGSKYEINLEKYKKRRILLAECIKTDLQAFCILEFSKTSHCKFPSKDTSLLD